MSGSHHVLVYVYEGDPSPWVLNLDGFAGEDVAQQAIRWQRQGGFTQRMEIFKREDIASLDLSRGPYTEKAWFNFLSTL